MQTIANKTANPRIQVFDNLKGIAILLIVLFHSAHTLNNLGIVPDNVLEILAKTFQPIRIPVLAFVFGYFLDKTCKTRSKLFSRLGRILLLAVGWGTAYYSFYGLINPQQWQTSFWVFVFTPINHIWFLWGLVYYIVLYLLILNRRQKPLLLMLAFTGFASYMLISYDVTAVKDTRIASTMLFFIAGSWFHYTNIKPFSIKLPFIISASLTLAPLVALAGYFMPLYSLYYTLICLAIIPVYLTFANTIPVLNVFSYFGRRSLPIYVMHLAFVLIGSIALVKVIPMLFAIVPVFEIFLNPYVAMVLVFISAVVGSLVTDWLWKKVKNTVTQTVNFPVLFGAKPKHA